MNFRLARIEDKPELFALWQEAFGDDFDTIEKFWSTVTALQKTLVCERENRIVSVIYLINADIVINGKSYSAYYVYAVATKKEYRHRGIMTELLKYAENISKQRNIDFLFLRPASEHLYDYYAKCGFETKFFQGEKTVFSEKLSLPEYGFVNWNAGTVELDASYNNTFKNQNGYLAYSKNKNEIDVEHYCSPNILALLSDFKNKFPLYKILFNAPVGDIKTAMLKPVCFGGEIPKNLYLGISLE